MISSSRAGCRDVSSKSGRKATWGLSLTTHVPESLRERNLKSDLLHLFVAFSFAFSGPMLDRMSRQALFVERMDFSVLFSVALILCVLIPGAVALVEIALSVLLPGKRGFAARSVIQALVI